MLVCLLVLGTPGAWAQLPIPAEAESFLQDLLRLTPQQREELQKVEVPWRTEQDFGRQLLLGYQQNLRRQGIQWSDRNRDARYLRGLVQRIRPLMSQAARYRQIQVYVVNVPDVDARSVPGGYLLFSRGLLEFAESEAALMGIVGHEISHLDRRHQLKPIQQQIRAQNYLAGPREPDAAEFFDLGQSMMKSFHPFHPDEEAEADRDGVDWMYRLGYDPRELARLFQRLADRPAGPNAPLPGFLQTHPLFPRRAQAVLEQYQRLQRADPRENLSVGREALAKRTPAPQLDPP